jgi:hypothetical protein
MSTATINLKVYPRRMLRKHESAHYVGLSVKEFDQVCDVKPIELRPKLYRWDMVDLDTWIDGLKTSLPSDDDEILARLS